MLRITKCRAKTCKYDIRKKNLPQIKSHGKYLGSTTRIYLRDIDSEKKDAQNNR